MDKWDNLMLIQDAWYEGRPIMEDANQDIGFLLHLLMTEVKEAQEAYQMGTDKELLSEISDVMIFAMSLFRMMGTDGFEEVREKMAFNAMRYESHLFQSGSYNEARKVVKKEIEPEAKKDFDATK